MGHPTGPSGSRGLRFLVGPSARVVPVTDPNLRAASDLAGSIYLPQGAWSGEMLYPVARLRAARKVLSPAELGRSFRMPGSGSMVQCAEIMQQATELMARAIDENGGDFAEGCHRALKLMAADATPDTVFDAVAKEWGIPNCDAADILARLAYLPELDQSGDAHAQGEELPNERWFTAQLHAHTLPWYDTGTICVNLTQWALAVVWGGDLDWPGSA